MTQEQLNERMAKKEQEIAKTEKLLNKYLSDSSDEYRAIIIRYLESGDYTEHHNYLKSQGKWYDGDIWSKAIALHDALKCLEKYQKQLETEIAKQNTLADIPEVLKKFRDDLIIRWDKFDLWKKEQIRKEYRNNDIEYRELRMNLRNKWGRGWYEFMSLTEEQIHKANVNAADALVMNLINRTIEIAGKITDCSYLTLDNDNQGYLIINGVVIGEKGKAKVESIGAGGYNIQRYHIRVLVKEVRA